MTERLDVLGNGVDGNNSLTRTVGRTTVGSVALEARLNVRAIAARVMLSLAVAACGMTETEPDRSVTPATQVDRPATPSALALVVNLDACDSIGGCRAYGSINRAGEAAGAEARLSFPGADHVAIGLPGSLDPGSYVVHFRFVAVSDASLNGVRAETTIATCDDRVLAQGTHLAEEIELAVTFRSESCDVTQTSKVADT